MRILVTGGSGFIGSALIRHLTQDPSNEVMNVDKLTYASSADALEGVEHYFVQADICDRQKIEEVIETFEPEILFHLAAESHVDRSIASATPFIQTNIIGTYTLLEVVRHWGKLSRFIHVSTDEVYGALQENDPDFNECSPYLPNSPYSASKACADHLCRAWAKTYSLPIIMTHCSNNFGKYQHDEKLIPTVVRTALEGNEIPIYGQGKNMRDWLYVNDHVRGLCDLINQGTAGEVYNFGGGVEMTNAELAKEICAILHNFEPSRRFEDQITFVKDRLGHDLRYSVNYSKINQLTGWMPTTPFSEGLNETVRWYYERYNTRGGARDPSLSSHQVCV